MAFTDTLQRTWRENILFSVLVELTYRCNLNCFFCYNDPHLRGVPLGTKQYIRFFEDLRALGTLSLTFSGGEPLARADFFTLGRQARDLGFMVRVKSNGHALNDRLARRLLREVDPFIVEVSLHGAHPETHDRQTRVPGSFGKLLANLREMRALGLRIKLNSPLTAWNESEIEAMFALADDWGLPIQFDTQITPRDDGDFGPLQIAPSHAGVARLFALQRQRATTHRIDQEPRPADATAETIGAKHCGAGSATVTIDPFGNVYPCVQWRRRVGNLHEQSIQTIWRHSGALAEVRRLAVEVKQGIRQHGTPGFGFCPGLAEQETGDPANLYSAARRLLELRQRASVS
ncbi:MAG: radical SAM protein [Candidatus Competibacter sp.]|nr:radical SAM protein [Candidatus Competibacter sp.]MDG4582560.1 radical SAM protein [Candidatus Competibacter sp.]